MKTILIPVTNHNTLGSTDSPNGTYAPELTHVLHEILNAGYRYDIASIKGGAAPLYGEDTEADEINASILANAEVQQKLANTLTLSDVQDTSYDAVFYPGGFGLLSDLAGDAGFAQKTAALYEQGAIVSAVCHGPAGLLPIELSNGQKLIADKRVTGFTREEEIDFGTIDSIPFLLEERLTRSALRYEKTLPWHKNVVVDGRLITGQNPQSAHGVGVELIKLLQAS